MLPSNKELRRYCRNCGNVTHFAKSPKYTAEMAIVMGGVYIFSMILGIAVIMAVRSK